MDRETLLLRGFGAAAGKFVGLGQILKYAFRSNLIFDRMRCMYSHFMVNDKRYTDKQQIPKK